MPFLIAKVNVPVDAKQETKLKSQLGKAIELLPGLSEKYLLVGLEADCHIYLRGNKSEPVAYIEVSIFGNDQEAAFRDSVFNAFPDDQIAAFTEQSEEG